MIELKHLTLNTKELTSFPLEEVEKIEFKSFAQELVKEGLTILDSPNWRDHQVWHKGVVETWSLYPDSFKVIDQDEIVVEESVVQPKKSFWGGGGGVVKSEKEKERDADKGYAFHMRKSTKGTDINKGGYSYECYYDRLAIKHAEQEVEYIATLARVEVVESKGRFGFLKMYNLPFPTTNRSFFVKVIVYSPDPTPHPTDSSLPPLRTFYTFSLPISPMPELTKELDHGFVRGKYVSVEEIKEVIGEDGEISIQMRLASMTTAGGSIPMRLSESHIQSSLASHIIPYFQWMSKKYPTVEDHPSSTHSKEHQEKSKKRLSIEGLKRSLSLSRS